MLQSEDNLSMTKKILAAFAIWLLIVGYAYFSRMRSIIDNQKFSKTSDPKNCESENSKKKIDVVILLTMMRSGSSIVGSIFNERINVTYLYEPLFPFGKQECNEKTRQSSLEVLRNLSNCHFENLGLLYQSSARNDFSAK